MYLTKMPLNRRRRGAIRMLSNPQVMHAAIASAFPPGSLAEAGGRALWRIDTHGRDEISLFIVSPTEPDLTHIVEQAGWQTGAAWQTRDYSPVLDGLRVGSRYSFRLRANPVHSIRRGSSRDTKPVAHVTVRYQEQWLADRAHKHGFAVVSGPYDVPSLSVVERGVMRFGKDGGRKVTIAHATFEGVLEVTDAALLRRALCEGIGRAKAYGCGLITLAPVAAVSAG